MPPGIGWHCCDIICSDMYVVKYLRNHKPFLSCMVLLLSRLWWYSCGVQSTIGTVDCSLDKWDRFPRHSPLRVAMGGFRFSRSQLQPVPWLLRSYPSAAVAVSCCKGADAWQVQQVAADPHKIIQKKN